LFDHSLDCVYVHDFEGNFLDANETALKLFGYEKKDIPHLNFASLLSEDQLPKAIATLQELRDTGAQKQLNEFRVRRKDGSFVDVEVISAVIYGNGKPCAIQGVGRDVTERRKVEEALQKSEERYRTLAENAGEAILVIQDDVVKFINPKGVELSGYSGEELASRPFAKFIYPDDIPMVADRYLKRLRGELVPQTYDFRIIRKDADIRWAELNAVPISWEDRPAVLCFMSDITERKQAGEALRQSEERYRTILEEMEDAYFEVDLAGNFTFVNNSVCRDLGYSRKELIGMSYKGHTVENDIESVFRVFNEVYRTGVPNKGFPWKTIRKDGSHGFAETSVSLLRNDKGEIIGFRGVGRDITDRKKMEEVLRQSEERYRTILEETGDGYFETDLAGNSTFVNDAQTRLLGYSREEIIGMNFRAFTPEDKVKAVFEAYNRMYKTGEPLCDFPTEIIRKDGSHGFAETSAFPIRNDKGEIIGFRGVRRDITERKKMEEALRQSEEKYRTILEEMEDSYFEVDLGGHLTFVNNSVCRDLGYSREELMGKSYKAFTVEEDIESVFRVFNEVYRTGVPNKGFPWKTVRKDGTHGFAETSISLLRNDKGETIGFRGVGRDISDRKRAEQALLDEAARRRILMEQSRDGIVILNQDGHVYDCNQKFADMVGYPFESMHQLTVFDWEYLYPPERTLEMIRNVDEKGDHFETKHRRKDGGTHDVEISTNAAVFAGQKLVFCICRDITERKQAEDKLRQSEENYRALFDSTVIGTVVLDAETMKIAMVNQAAVKMFALSSAEEALEVDPFSFILPEDRERYLEIDKKALFEQNSHEAYEIRAVTKDGREKWINATATMITHKGKLAALISFADITEQKKQTERLMMTDRLASLGELASGTAHELNNPLTSIIGFSQLLMEKEVPDDIREDLKLINAEAQRAASVTRNLLTFARKHAPVKEPNQINNIIEDVLRLRAHEHKADGIEVERQFDPDLPEVMVDYFQMQQVFMNIVINAEYFMVNAHNRGRLTITTKGQNDTVLVLFTDDGPGIPSENLRRIFDPFFTTKEAGKGTGLGLSICHGIVTEHGGQIYARSQLGQGATIVVELPVNGRRQS
jgi:two-component system NtrC family sensor kinase